MVALVLWFAGPASGCLDAQEPPGTAGDEARVPSPDSLSAAYEALARKTLPAVVHVAATSLSVRPETRRDGSTRLSREGSRGSGVIVDPQGYIVTNAHLVESAERVQVLMPTTGPKRPEGPPGESILKPRGEVVDASIVGIDRETDLAVLKVEASGLPHLELGNSDELRPGQVVLAFESPLGLENSVSMGVVSSVARQLRPEGPMIYIQTDAAVNPGNSGGPLVNGRGEVVGINTFIFSRSGGSEGVGFAAPSNIVRHVYRQIVRHGRVRRGVIGVHAQTITPVMAEALQLPRSWGVLIADVFPGSPAARAGLRRGDVVLRLNGKVMENGRQLDVNIYPYGPGDTVRLEVLRGSRRTTVRVPVRLRPDELERLAELVNPEENLISELGVLALEVDRRVAALLPPLRRADGVVVAASVGEIRTESGEFRPGDVIHAVNRLPVSNLVELRTAVDKIGQGEAAAVLLERAGRFRYLTFELRR